MSAEKTQFSMRVPMTFGIISLLILVGGFGGWAATTQIAGAIIASGAIEVDQNRQVVQHPDGGVVSEILVDEGDTVQAGDPLIRLDPTLLEAELAIVNVQYFELIARRGRLTAERDGTDDITFDPIVVEEAARDPHVAELMTGQENLFHVRRETMARELEQLDKRRDQIADQIRGIVAQQEALTRQNELIQEELTDKLALQAKGLTQATQVLSLQREQARLSGEVGELTASKAQAEGQITEIEIQKITLEVQLREEAITTLRDMQFREREYAEQRRALLEQLSRMDITAPLSGIVYGLTVFAERSVVRAADPILYLVPQDRPLVIAAQVEAIHVDQVYFNQDVTLRFSALDQRQTPELFGTVSLVSADAFEDETTGQRYYRAEIALNPDELSRLPEGTILVPGMPVEAFIRTADRTPLAYLVKPFTDYLNKAFRES